ncbi:MAG: hypothetical protein OEM96_08560 [Gemmatimonadota bacterium]|nr:hypothetical protein [Gemmatimonadota bacterium]
MDMKRLMTGAVVGGIALFVLGYLFYGMLLVDFFAGQVTTEVGREAPIFWAIGLGELLMAILVTMAIIKSGSSGWMEGAKVGAIVGFLAWGAVNMIQYGVIDIYTLTGHMSDAIVELVRHGLAGAVIAMVAGGKSPAVG